MITALLGLVSYLVPGAGALGIWGLILKFATSIGASWVTKATTGPVLSIVATLAEGVVEIIVWSIKSTVGYVGSWFAAGLDHIAKDVKAFTVVMAAVFCTWYYVEWSTACAAQPAQTQRSQPKKVAPKPVAKTAEKKCYLPPILDQLC